MKLTKNVVSVIIGMIAILASACGSSEKKTPDPSTENQALQPFEDARMYFTMNQSKLSELNQNDTLAIHMNESDESYHLVIRKVQESIPGIMAISANVGDKDTGLATLLYRDDRLSGFMDLYKTNQRFQIIYDQEKEAYFMDEVKPEERDEIEGSAPLIPPDSLN